jgi:hypothetical protein
VARTEVEARPEDVDDRQRVRVRIISIVVAAALVVTAAIVLTRHHPPARSTQAFCTRMAAAKDLGKVLASGDANQITAAVHRLDQAAQVAPPAIESQALVLTTYADGLARAVTQAANAKTGLRQALSAQQGQLPAVNTAGASLDAFVSANCHLQLGTTAADTVPSVASTTPG